jgi:hypothetical protein
MVMNVRKDKYQVLSGLINDRGIKKSVIAKRLGISPKTLCGKLRGETGFVFDEAQIIREDFFPDVALERLFSVDEADQTA